MKKMLFAIAVAILFTVSLSSCMGTRYGCPVSASRGFGPGRI